MSLSSNHYRVLCCLADGKKKLSEILNGLHGMPFCKVTDSDVLRICADLLENNLIRNEHPWMILNIPGHMAAQDAQREFNSLWHIGPVKEPGAVHAIGQERVRQISEKGYNADHDDGHKSKEIAIGAMCFLEAYIYGSGQGAKHEWPWSPAFWSPSHDPVMNLVKAGAMIAAEIDRLNRVKTAGQAAVATGQASGTESTLAVNTVLKALNKARWVGMDVICAEFPKGTSVTVPGDALKFLKKANLIIGDTIKGAPVYSRIKHMASELEAMIGTGEPSLYHLYMALPTEGFLITSSIKKRLRDMQIYPVEEDDIRKRLDVLVRLGYVEDNKSGHYKKAFNLGDVVSDLTMRPISPPKEAKLFNCRPPFLISCKAQVMENVSDYENPIPEAQRRSDLVVEITTLTATWTFPVKRDVMNEVFKMIVPPEHMGVIDFEKPPVLVKEPAEFSCLDDIIHKTLTEFGPMTKSVLHSYIEMHGYQVSSGQVNLAINDMLKSKRVALKPGEALGRYMAI